MRAVIQRVNAASVAVDNVIVGQIGPGLLVLLGVGDGDAEKEATFIADKIANLRIFSDVAGRFNLSVLDRQGAVLVVSQFTLYADVRRGRRPSFSFAAPPEIAAPLVERVVAALRGYGLEVACGVFGAHMIVDLQNDGPVTITLDTATFQVPRRT